VNERNDRPFWRWLGNGLAVLVTAWIAAVVALPIIWLIMTSFKSGPDITSLKPVFVFKPTLENYAAILADSRVPIVEAMINSIIVSVASTLVSVALAAITAYSLARLRPPGYRLIGLTIFGARMLPPVALVIPLFLAANWVGQLDTRLSLIVPYIALSIPLGTWMLQGFFLDLPKELEEAALVDGAGHLQAFLRVILPLTGPGLAAVSIFSFSLSWNDLVLALPLTSERAVTLPVIASRIRTDEGILWGQLGAITTIIMLPMLIFTLVVQRWLIRGLTAGAVKG
jgi:ABC-type glycerol-3-phosphate transport system permease component